LAIIKVNGDVEPTNEQYQKEEPDFIKWFLEKEMHHDLVSRQTGLRIGVVDNIEMLEQKPLMNPDFQRQIPKMMDMREQLANYKKESEKLNHYQGRAIE